LARPLCHHKLSQAAPAVGQSLSWRPINTGDQDIMSFLYLIFLSSSCFLLPLQSVHAQSISTSTPVPPLQWINLTGLFQGPAAPPLKDASIGYDNNSRTLVIFGGESQGGIPQQRTYLCVIYFFLYHSFPLPQASIIFSSVSTSTPSSGPLHPPKAERPPRHHPQEVPPSGAVISAQASMSFSLFSPPTNQPLIATSSRNGYVLFGGRGADGLPLSDVWVRSNMLAVAQPQFMTICRNMTTTTNSGPRSIRHQARLRRPPSKVQ
jgi:hypothetical protein